jgi:CBS domain-containing membrane protein
MSESNDTHQALAAMTVAELMSEKLSTARASELVHQALGRMRGHHFRHMPVVDDEGEMLGVVSDRDLFLALMREPEPTVGAVMTRYTKWVTSQSSAREAADLLLKDKIGCLPVLDDNILVGIVTETDFVEVASRALSLLEMIAQRAT